MNFIFGGDTDLSAEQIQRRRQIAQSLMPSGNSRNAAEGIGNAARMISSALINRKADKAEQRGRDAFNEQFAQQFPDANSQTSAMYDSPYANDRQKKVIEAMMAGVPGYRNGTRSAPGGLAVVGEDGPELMHVPKGSEIVPNPLSEYLFQGGNGAPFQPGNEADDAPAEYRNLSPDMRNEIDNMTQEERSRVMQQLFNGVAPDEAMQPQGFSPREMIQGNAGPDGLVNMPQVAENRFQDEKSYQTADSNQISSDAVASTEPAPTPTELAQMGERVGIDPQILQGLDLNSTESRNFGYLLRMMEAENTIRELEDSNTLGQRLLELLPGRDLESMLMDPDYRRYTLARENFNEAALRSATGATINQQEMPLQRQNYFPLPTDDEATRSLLQRQRQALMMALTAGSGPAGAVIPSYGDAVVPRGVQRQPPGTGQNQAETIGDAPRGVPADVWAVMTPEERALWTD